MLSLMPLFGSMGWSRPRHPLLEVAHSLLELLERALLEGGDTSGDPLRPVDGEHREQEPHDPKREPVDLHRCLLKRGAEPTPLPRRAPRASPPVPAPVVEAVRR